jgi:hypothetical protein
MVGIGGLNKSKIDRKHCCKCGKVFVENESKSMRPGDRGFWCIACDGTRGAHG